MNNCNNCKYPTCCKVGIFASVSVLISSALYYGYNLYLKRTKQEDKEDNESLKTEM